MPTQPAQAKASPNNAPTRSGSRGSLSRPLGVIIPLLNPRSREDGEDNRCGAAVPAARKVQAGRLHDNPQLNPGAFETANLPTSSGKSITALIIVLSGVPV
jgi:hypothetical protein